MEYQCFYLNPEYKLGHDDDAKVLFESNNLGEACSFVYNKFKQEKRDIAVYQPRTGNYRVAVITRVTRTGNYREIHQNKLRDSKGRFA